ncbi:MAG: hypothetical protein R3C14_41205 [Caldilineaceae bacterium]
MQVGKELVAGAAGGVVGTLAMTTVRVATENLGLLEEPLPHKLTRRAAEKMGAGGYLSALQENLLASGEHLMIGAAYGVGYSWFHQTIHRAPTVDGPLYGGLVYALNLVGIGPMLHLTHSPWNEASTTIGRRLLVHLLYGLVTGVVAGQINQRVFDGKAQMHPIRPQPIMPIAATPQRAAAPCVQPQPQFQGDAFRWAARMMTAPGVHGQLQRKGDYLIGYTVTKRGEARTGDGAGGPPETVYLEIIVADTADQHAIPDLRVQAKLVDQHGDEVSTHQQPLRTDPWPRHYGRIWRVPGPGDYTLYIRVESPLPPHSGQMSDRRNGWRQVEPVEVTFSGITIDTHRGEAVKSL